MFMDAGIPMGRLDMIEVAGKKMTFQTEYFAKPNRHAETKVYFGGALKKIFERELDSVPDSEMEKVISSFHQEKVDEVVAMLRKKSETS